MTEEELLTGLEKLEHQISLGACKNPGAMTDAFFVVVMETAILRFNELIKGIESEFTEQDRLNILSAYVNDTATFWEDPNLEEAYEMGVRILREFAVQCRSKERIVTKKFKIK